LSFDRQSRVILFHATRDILQVGEVVTADRETLFYPDAVAALDQARPTDAQSRSTCLFAAESPIACCEFMRAQGVGDFRIYKVKMPKFSNGPFCIIHQISARIQDGRPYDALISEYWTGDRDWNFLEYFGPQFSVLELILDRPSFIESASFRISYDADVKRVGRL